jgi:hypothetical protein
MLELMTDNFDKPLSNTHITEFLLGLGGSTVVHSDIPTAVGLSRDFEWLTDLSIPSEHRPQDADDPCQGLFAFSDRQMFNAYEVECRRIGRELSDREMFRNGVQALRQFRMFHGWALTEGVWVPHVWICLVDPLTAEPTTLIEVGPEMMDRYVGTNMSLIDARKITQTFGHRTPDDARQALLALREVQS